MNVTTRIQHFNAVTFLCGQNKTTCESSICHRRCRHSTKSGELLRFHNLVSAIQEAVGQRN